MPPTWSLQSRGVTKMTAVKIVIFLSLMTSTTSATSRGLVRFQRGDQGPDDDINHPGFTENPNSNDFGGNSGQNGGGISIINEDSSRTDLIVPPIGGKATYNDGISFSSLKSSLNSSFSILKQSLKFKLFELEIKLEIQDFRA